MGDESNSKQSINTEMCISHIKKMEREIELLKSTKLFDQCRKLEMENLVYKKEVQALAKYVTELQEKIKQLKSANK